jgi:hypothetical protein
MFQPFNFLAKANNIENTLSVSLKNKQIEKIIIEDIIIT